MIRSFVVCGAVLFLACTTVPLGQCEDDSGCLPGLRCAEGVCVGCGGDGECQAWEACTADRRCELRAGMCGDDSQCESWEVCGASNTCELAEGFCLAAADCHAYEDCNGSTKRCELQAGRCSTAESCGSSSLWAPTCDADNWCHSAPTGGNDVLLWGTLLQSVCGVDAISSVTTPTHVQVGFDCDDSIGDAVVSPDGRVLYLDAGAEPARVKAFVPDAFIASGTSRSYPKNGTANDTVLPAPGCQATDDVLGFVVQAGTGTVAYACRASGARVFYDTAGQVVVDDFTPLAWNAQNHMIGHRGFSSLSVLTPEGNMLPVTGPPLGYRQLDTRAAPTGFWLAILTELDIQQLWRVGHDGAATLVVTYGAFPEEAVHGTVGTLDAEGNLYCHSVARSNRNVDVIVRRLADGSPGTLVYSEAHAPPRNSESSYYLQPFNYMDGTRLFGGP